MTGKISMKDIISLDILGDTPYMNAVEALLKKARNIGEKGRF